MFVLPPSPPTTGCGVDFRRISDTFCTVVYGETFSQSCSVKAADSTVVMFGVFVTSFEISLCNCNYNCISFIVVLHFCVYCCFTLCFLYRIGVIIVLLHCCVYIVVLYCSVYSFIKLLCLVLLHCYINVLCCVYSCIKLLCVLHCYIVQ